MKTISDLERAITAQSNGSKIAFKAAEDHILGYADLLQEHFEELGIEEDDDDWQRIRDLQHEVIETLSFIDDEPNN